MLFAYLMAVTVNLHKGKDDEPAKIEDFLLDFWAGQEQGEAEGQSLEEQRRIIEAMKLVFERG